MMVDMESVCALCFRKSRMLLDLEKPSYQSKGERRGLALLSAASLKTCKRYMCWQCFEEDGWMPMQRTQTPQPIVANRGCL